MKQRSVESFNMEAGMRTSTRTRSGAALLSIAALLLTACNADDTKDPTAGGTSAPAATGTAGGAPIRVGISLPLTGDFAEPGKGIKEGYEVWAETVNKAGGLLGRQVQLTFRDDASDANRVTSDYESLISRDKVDMVFGPFSTRLVIPGAKVAEANKMLFLEPAGAAPDVFKQGFKYLFYAAPAVADDHYDYLAEYILAMPDDKRPKTAAYAAMDDPFAQGTAYGLKAALEKGGIRTVANEVYPPETTNFGPIAAKVADKKADLFVGGTQYEDSVGLVRAFQELDYQPKMAAFSTGPTLPEFDEALGDAINGILSPVGWAIDSGFETNKEFVDAFKGKFNKDPNEDAANGYTVGQIAAAAIQAVGCAEQGDCQTKLRDHVLKTEFKTVVGPLSFEADGRPKSAHMIQQKIDGKTEIVLPAGQPVTTAELLFPKPEW
jgi:branched-chain amino acid transport system substrate-binding protein